MKTKQEMRVVVHRLRQSAAQRGGSLADILDAIEEDPELLSAFMLHDDPEFEALKSRLKVQWAERRRVAN